MSMHAVLVSVIEGNRELWSGNVVLPLEIRCLEDTAILSIDLQNQITYRQLVISPAATWRLPPHAIRIEALDGLQMRVINVHTELTFEIDDEGIRLPPSEQFLCDKSVRLFLTNRRDVQVAIVSRPLAPWEPSLPANHENSLPDVRLRPNAFDSSSLANLRQLLMGYRRGIDGSVPVQFVRSVVEVVREAAGFDAACAAATEMVGLDRAAVLLYMESRWHQQAVKLRGGDSNFYDGTPNYNDALLARVQRTATTVIYDPAHLAHGAGSPLTPRAVASPIVDRSGKVIGVLYGEHDPDDAAGGGPIGYHDALLLDAIAGAVSFRLARDTDEDRVRDWAARMIVPQSRVTEEVVVLKPNLTGKQFDPADFVGCTVADLAEELGWMAMKSDPFIRCLNSSGNPYVPDVFASNLNADQVSPVAKPIGSVPWSLSEIDIIALAENGPFGVLYSGKLRHDGQDVTIQVISSERNAGAALDGHGPLDLVRICHPCVVRVFGVHLAGNFWIIVMELLVGQRISVEAIKDPRPTMACLSDAVLHMIDATIVHCDLKPGNIVLRDSDMNPVISNFGLATNFTAAASRGPAGTPYFMPPEAWENKVSRTYDAYSLGVTAAVLLRPKTNWPSLDPLDLPTIKASGEFTSLTMGQLQGVDKDLQSWVSNLLSADQDTRLQALKKGVEWLP